MEQFSTSKVTVEYFDPHDVYKLIAPGLIPRLPLRNLHWQARARSIDTLHVELAPASPSGVASPELQPKRSASISASQDGFQTQIGGLGGPVEVLESPPSATSTSTSASTPQPLPKVRRHQIPGLRRTPYLKVLLVRCDDGDSYKSTVRSEIREWIKKNTPSQASKKGTPEGHDAFEWLIVHVVLPNTVAATQPRTSKSADTSEQKTTSRWRGGSSTLLEKLRADFNVAGKHTADHVAQVRVGINDVPYDMLPRVVPAVPSGYVETEQDVEAGWLDLVAKFKALILTSFDMRVTRYEEDIKERDAQRILPGWNFCTFFMLKEGLARGFESVGLVEDALVGYDQLSVGLDTVVAEQATASSPTRPAGALLPYTDELKAAVDNALRAVSTDADEETVDLQSDEHDTPDYDSEDIPIIASKKPYRDMILANNVSLFDFKCYIFARQISLLLRMGNAWSTREELLAKLNEQRESVLHGVAPRLPPPPKNAEEPEYLSMLSEICRRTLEFIPAVSRVMEQDIMSAVAQRTPKPGESHEGRLPPSVTDVVEHMVASFAFSVVQQILAQTSTKALPIPPSTLNPTASGQEPKLSIPEPKTMMHPARSSSLNMPPGSRPPPSPNVFPGGRSMSVSDAGTQSQFLKTGLEELAGRRAELYTLCRNILEKLAKKKGWGDGWSEVPILPDSIDYSDLEDVSLSDDEGNKPSESESASEHPEVDTDTLTSSPSVIPNRLLRAAFASQEDFHRLYETLTDKALRHYTVANHTHSVHSCLADLAVLKYKASDLEGAAAYFDLATPFFGDGGWTLVELSMLVMYARCLGKLDRKKNFVQVVLTLLMKAAAAEAEYAKTYSLSKAGSKPDLTAVKGLVGELLDAAGTLARDVVVLLDNFFLSADIVGQPRYLEGEDSFEVDVEVYSLLLDELPVEKASLRLACVDGGPTKEILLESRGQQVLKPGKDRLTFVGRVVATGRFKVDQLTLRNGKLVLSYERDINQVTPKDDTLFMRSPILIYQQTQSLDLQLTAARATRLDQNNALELEILTGWNTLGSCEVAVKPATGGLRTITHEAKVVTPDIEFARAPEAGMVFFGAIPARSSVRVSFPFSVEVDVPTITVRLEATYTTTAEGDGEGGTATFRCAKVASIPIALALGVNVQDVFKHAALYSRFTVSTASPAPLRLLRSEMLDSEVFEASFGVPPSSAVLVVPKQPATLLYKISRKDAEVTAKTKGTMFLKLHYSSLREEVDDLLKGAIEASLEEGDNRVSRFARLVVPSVVRHAWKSISALDLERIALTGRVSTAFLSGINWRAELQGLGVDKAGAEDKQISTLTAFFSDWQRKNKTLPVEGPTDIQSARSILIPVDIPSVPALVTADIKLHPSTPVLGPKTPDSVPTVCVNQVLPATLQLRWTRRWDTTPPPTSGNKSAKDRKLSFEVTSPPETWLIGGRRKGHISVPADTQGPDSTLEMPLVLSPLREGWLAYPTVEVKEVNEGGSKEGGVGLGTERGGGHCEVDGRNLGEAVRVVAERERITLSLDSSGPGGGPLVLESETVGRDVRVLA